MKHLRLIMGVWAVCLASPSWALQINPTYQILTVKPGQKIEGRCTVTNDDAEKLSVNLSAKDWFVMKENQAFKAQEWLTFDAPQFELEPGEAKSVQFTIHAPSKAKGELVGMMSYAFNGEKASNVQKVLSVAIYAAMAGTEKLKGELKAISLEPSTSSLSVGLLIRNEGNIHIRPEGWCEVKNDQDQTVANVFIQQGKPVYPGQENSYSGAVNDLRLAPGRYKALVRLTDVDRKVTVIQGLQDFKLTDKYKVELK
jgi:hypothetical protein